MRSVTVSFHWTKGDRSGEGRSSVDLGPEPSQIDIALAPVSGVSLWLDLDLAPALLQVHEIAILDEARDVLHKMSDHAAIRRLLTGSMAWWVAGGEARLLSIGERNLLRIDVAESSAPAHAVRLRMSLVEDARASRLAQALSDVLQEQRAEHEAFVRQIDGILESLQEGIGAKRAPSTSLSDLAGRLWKRVR